MFSEKLLPRFGHFLPLVLHGEFETRSNKVTIAICNKAAMGKARLVIPPRGEQQAIADFLDRETAKIDALVEKIENAIKLLKEYRTALISAAVTGKIDVRNEMT